MLIVSQRQTIITIKIKIMWEHFLIRLGFRNTYQGGQITGFQFMFTIPYYRGVFLSCISTDFMVRVDGVTYPLEDVSIKIGDKVVPWSQVDMAYDLFWPYGTAATVLVNKPGGLTVGLHKVEMGFVVRKSYMNEDPDPEGYYSWTSSYGAPAPAAAPPQGAAQPQGTARQGAAPAQGYGGMTNMQTCSLDMVLVM